MIIYSHNIDSRINVLVRQYEKTVLRVDEQAISGEGSYGGILRSVKGKLQEDMTEEIIKIAWASLGGNSSRMEINKKRHKIYIKEEYLQKIDQATKRHIELSSDNCYYGVSVDKQIYIDNNLVIGIECKSYTENAMLKRVLVDFDLIKSIYPEISCYLFQLESQLGGDYSDFGQNTSFGSKKSHVLMSYFPRVKLNIFTFLSGERRVDRPIHKSGFFKPLEVNQVLKAVDLLTMDLQRHIK